MCVLAQYLPLISKLLTTLHVLYSCKYKVGMLIMHNPLKAWTNTGRVSKDDWSEWLRRLGVELLKESPSPALRSCWALAQAYNTLARELFNAAFVSCWMELK